MCCVSHIVPAGFAVSVVPRPLLRPIAPLRCAPADRPFDHRAPAVRSYKIVPCRSNCLDYPAAILHSEASRIMALRRMSRTRMQATSATFAHLPRARRAA